LFKGYNIIGGFNMDKKNKETLLSSIAGLIYLFIGVYIGVFLKINMLGCIIILASIMLIIGIILEINKLEV
jgi:ABC-type Mn2+/Zn2+ transport system permease subunit